MKRQFCQKMEYDLKGHTIYFSYRYIFCSNLLKIYTNANIMKTKICYKMNYDLKGHRRLNKAIFADFFSSTVIYEVKIKGEGLHA